MSYGWSTVSWLFYNYVLQSDLTRFTGSTKYPLPSKKATAVKLGIGGNGFVFAIFHNGKEYAVKKVRNLVMTMCTYHTVKCTYSYIHIHYSYVTCKYVS